LRHYELVVILSPMLNQEQASDTWGRIKGFINNRDAEIFHEETWGTRRLAYSIRKGSHHFLEGTYHLTRFSTETPFNKELETFLRQDEQVLRSMVVVGDPPKPESETVAVAAPPVVEAVPVPAEETPEPPAAVVEDAVEETPAAAEEATAVVEEAVEETLAAAEETSEEPTAVVEEVVEDTPAVAEETSEEPAAVVEEVAEDTPAVAEETSEEATDVVEEVVEESPAESEDTTEDAPEDEPTNT